MTFAACHPGKIGDALYSLPAIREIYRQTGEKCDFYTSSYCEPMRKLMLYQDCINDFIVPSNYKVERFDCGAQPWYMDIDESQYSAVYQFGFRSVPDRALHQFIALYAGIDKPLDIEYNYPNIDEPIQNYYVVAPRGSSSYANLFYNVGKRLIDLGYGLVVIGGDNENIFNIPEVENPYLIDFTGKNMLNTVSILSKAQGFFGLMSSQLVLANGFNFPKVAPHDGRSWDMRHVIYSIHNHYPVDPSTTELLRLLDA
jgi:hypothetical protein